MRFWDTSAIVPLCVSEPATPALRALTEDDPAIVVWWGTLVEIQSAIARRARDGSLAGRAAAAARRRLAALATTWSEVSPTDPIRERAGRLLAVHPLRAADALQLAASLLWSRGRTGDHTVVVLDERLRDAAEREGFRVLPARSGRQNP